MVTGEALARQYVETFNRRDVAGWAALFTADAVIHAPLFPESIKGRDAIEALLESIWRAFPDMQWRLLRPVIDAGDRVAFELAANGVNDGPLEMPDGELSATGRPVSFETAVCWSVGQDGLVTEERSYFDATGVAAQLGLTS
ncbi:ester cyclase [Nitriliruptor alkaliphilus]|uniref:ester cyclase n=1 Tax=Nitriliruptor alkaliphilus TaxID=427918 RepID=UPI000695B589|nr:nuclear transport factor 2 family protein [Nitriliruptor alkaliphilus]